MNGFYHRLKPGGKLNNCPAESGKESADSVMDPAARGGNPWLVRLIRTGWKPVPQTGMVPREEETVPQGLLSHYGPRYREMWNQLIDRTAICGQDALIMILVIKRFVPPIRQMRRSRNR